MFEKLKKVLKRSCKNQGRNITTCTVVAFLLLCSMTIGATEVKVKFDNTQQKIVITADGSPTVTYGDPNKDTDDGENKIWKITTSGVDNGVFNENTNLTVNANVSGLSIKNDASTNPVAIGNITIEGNLSGTITNINTTYDNNQGNGFALASYSPASETEAIAITKGVNISGILIGKVERVSSENNSNIGNGFALASYISRGTSGAVTIAEGVNISGNLTGTVREVLNRYNSNIGNGFALASYSPASGTEVVAIAKGVNISGNLTGRIESITEDYNSNIGNGFALASYSAGSSAGEKSVTITGGVDNNGNLIGVAKNISSRRNANIGNGFALVSFAHSSSGVVTIAEGIDNSGNLTGIAETISSENNTNIGNGFALTSFSRKFSKEVTISTFVNSGTISGYVGTVTDTSSNKNYGNGVGLVSYGGETSEKASIGTFTNTGLIMGKEHGLYIEGDADSRIGTYANYGIIAGGKPVEIISDSDKVTPNTSTELGILITLNGGSTTIDKVGNGGVVNDLKIFGESQKDYFVINGASIESESTKTQELNSKILNEKVNKLTDEERANFVANDKMGYQNLILNGVGTTLTVDSNLRLENSVVNSYGTAISITGETAFQGNDIIINGGELRTGKDDANTVAVAGDENANTFILKGNSILNGDINMGEGADTVLLTGNVKVHGDIIFDNPVTRDNNTDKDTLYFGEGEYAGGTRDEIKINGKIEGADTINIVNQEVTMSADSRINGDSITLNIGTGGVLNIAINPTEYTEENGTKKYNGHALANTTGLIINGDTSSLGNNGENVNNPVTSNTSAGTLNFMTHLLEDGSIIVMNGVKLDKAYGNLDSDKNESVLVVETNTILDKIEAVSEGLQIKADKSVVYKYFENNQIDEVKDPDFGKVEEKPNPPDQGGDKPDGGDGDQGGGGNFDIDFVHYANIDKIYQGAINGREDNFTALKTYLSSFDKDDQIIYLLKYLKEVYTDTPYSFTSELSRKSTAMFRNIVADNSFIPEYKKWMITGGLTHIDGGTKDTYYGKGFYGFDTGSVDVDADSKITGAYAMGKYGYSDTLTLGIIAGGNKSETEFSTDSKAKGNGGYIGLFAENYRGNLTLKVGAGVQYTEYDADRKSVIGNYSDKYSDTVFDIYGSLRYSLPLENNFFLEPYGVLAYTHIDQEGIDEGNKALAIETEDKKFDYTILRTGVNLKKVIPTEKAKHTLSVGVAYDRILDGYEEEYITAHFKEGTDFDILTAHKNKHSLSLNGKYQVKLQNGITADIKAEYSFERDEHNNGAKNKTEGEWTVGAGIGYKF